jgi:methylthioribose-1-phosphate isomerase
MNINGKPYQTIWLHPQEPGIIQVIDQRQLPHRLVIAHIKSAQEAAQAIREMVVRGAPLIGVTAAYGYYLGTLEASADRFEEDMERTKTLLADTRPTAVNLAWALETMQEAVKNVSGLKEKRITALETANRIRKDDMEMCRQIGLQALPLLESISRKKNGAPVNILTHCNAGWLACVEWGTATAVIYQAHRMGIPLHIWVDETRPRNQGAGLTAFELAQEGIPHTLIADNTGGHLMQHGLVDIVITGADRVTADGDVANKIGTYLKALAAKDNNIPYYAAVPSSTIDWMLKDGVKNIPIEERNADEVRYVQGWYKDEIVSVRICPEATPAANYGFDVTPARLVTGIITEKGIAAASEAGLQQLFQS